MWQCNGLSTNCNYQPAEWIQYCTKSCYVTIMCQYPSPYVTIRLFAVLSCHVTTLSASSVSYSMHYSMNCIFWQWTPYPHRNPQIWPLWILMTIKYWPCTSRNGSLWPLTPWKKSLWGLYTTARPSDPPIFAVTLNKEAARHITTGRGPANNRVLMGMTMIVANWVNWKRHQNEENCIIIMVVALHMWVYLYQGQSAGLESSTFVSSSNTRAVK